MYDNSNIGYVRTRLNGTIVRERRTGVPVYVEDCETGRGNNPHVSYRVLEKEGAKRGGVKSCPITDLALDSPPLGYTNLQDTAQYVTRMSVRNDWRQGLRTSNLGVIVEGRSRPFREGYSTLITPITNTYPTYAECVNRVEDIFSRQAWCRTMAINSLGRIIFKERYPIGEDNGNGPVLYRRFYWLVELLNQSIRGKQNHEG
jgi:hypothetical protein